MTTRRTQVPCWLGSIGSRRSCCSSHTTCTGHTRSRHLARTASTATPAVMARGHGQPPPPPLLQRWPPGSKPVYITTPLFYVNGRPHVGHLYSALVGDALARWYRLRHASTFLLVGTDEHGLKVQQAAAAAQGGAGISVAEYASHQSAAFRALFDEAGIGYDRFLRTSEPEHAAAVRRLWRTLAASGSIKHGSHAGWYCVADETFVPESQVVLAGEQQEKGGSSSGGNGGCSGGGQRVSAESGRPVEWASEDNYLFKLGSKRAALREWLYTAPAASAGTKVEEAAAAATAGQWSWSARVTPPGAAAWVESALRGGDDDDDDDDGCSAGADAQELSVSRPVERVSWGIEVPDDPSHTVYVWMDALCNYLTAAGYAEVDDPASMPLWPPDHQVLGKDILKFHAVYWPSFLAAAGLPLPQRLHSHAHWQAHDGTKMSKTAGNVACPAALLHDYGAQATRYYLLRDGPHGGKDVGFSEANLISRCNTDLANTLGNLLLRAMAPKMCPGQVWPPRRQPAAGDEVADPCGGGASAAAAAATSADRESDAQADEREAALRATIAALPGEVDRAVREGRVGVGVAGVMGLLQLANAHFQASEPWKVPPAPPPSEEMVPESAAAGLDMLGIPDTVKERGVDALVFGYGSEGVRSFGEPVALFTKLEKMDKGADSPD